MSNNNSNGRIRPAVAGEIDSISAITGEVGQNATFSLAFLQPPLNETEMVAVAVALSHNTHVTEVRLRGCLNSSAAVATSTFLKELFATQSSIKESNLGGNKLKSNSAEVIGLSLKTNTSLKELSLNYSNIGPRGAEAVARGLWQNKSLQILHLYSNQVGDMGVTALAEALRVNKTLEKLELGNCEITAKGVKALASALEKSSLKELIIDFNGFGDEGGKALAKSLCKNNSLTRLDLLTTGIGDETCKALAAALCNNCTLRELDLEDNPRITNVGAKAIEDTLKHLNYAVEDISLHGTEITMYQRDRINHLCRLNRHINTFFQQVNQNIPTIPLSLWPRVLEAVECKPDLLFALLKTKPEVCRELQHHSRRRRRPDWLRY